jgi:CelD/BcsL family acetyltransferase involved in cellulose biosynthesis
MNAVIKTPAAEVLTTSFAVECTRGGLEVVEQWRDEWSLLCADAAEDQPFYRPEWMTAYLKRYSNGSNIWIITARRDGQLCLLLPLLEQVGTFNKVPVRKLHSPVNCFCGRFDAVRVKGTGGDAAVRATWNYLKELAGWDMLQFRYSLEGSTTEQIVAAARADGYLTAKEPDKSNPYIALPNEVDHLKQMPHNSKLRSQLRQLARRLTEKGTVKFSRIDVADQEALDRFYKLEASGWKGKMRTCALYDGSKAFYDEVARAAARSGYFALYTLELDQRLLAAHFSFVHRGRCYSPKVAYDEEFKAYAPGHLIISGILQDCVLRGVHCYDITGEDQPWKMKWATGTRAINHHSVFRGALGRLAHTVRFRLRPTMGRLLRPTQQSACRPTHDSSTYVGFGIHTAFTWAP